MDMPALTRAGSTMEDVRTAITTANANRPKGVIEDAERHWQVVASDQLSKPRTNTLPLIVSYRNGSAVRLGDCRRGHRFGAGSAQLRHHERQSRGAGGLHRQSDANIIEAVDRIKALMPICAR